MKDHRPRILKPLDAAGLEWLAMHYVARYATTELKLRQYLIRKMRQRGVEGEPEALIGEIVGKVVAAGFVDDDAFATMRTGALLRRGYGARRIGGALREAGISFEITAEKIEMAPLTPTEAAHIYAKRRRIGPYSAQAASREGRQRAIATLLRAGHSYDDARNVLEDWDNDASEC